MKQLIARLVYPKVFEDLTQYQNKLQQCRAEILHNTKMQASAEQKIIELHKQLQDTREDLVNAQIELEKTTTQISYIDEYLSKQYKQTANHNYKQKRKYQEHDVTVSPNEMITPTAYEVLKFSRTLHTQTDIWQFIVAAGSKTARTITWTDDKNLATSGDYYLYPNETLISKKGDCEDHAFVMASILPTHIGIAYGFYIQNGQKVGHAWNVAVYKNELWYIDTVTNRVQLGKMQNSDIYYAHYILTPTKTYELDGSVRFGKLAGW